MGVDPGSQRLLGSHRAVRRSGGAPTGGVAFWVVGAPAPSAKAGSPISSFWPGDLLGRHHFSIPPRHFYVLFLPLLYQRRQIRWAVGLQGTVFILCEVMRNLGQGPASQ